MAALVLVGWAYASRSLADALVDELQALLEGLFQLGRIEDDVADLLPVVALVLPADDADGALELLAAQPQFAVERHVGQAGDEPVGGVEEIAQPRQELLAVPEGADAVELLAQPPAGRVGDAVPALGQQQRRRLSVFLARLSLRTAGKALPMRASSAASPRSLRRCLQVRRSMASDWLRQAGQVQE